MVQYTFRKDHGFAWIVSIFILLLITFGLSVPALGNISVLTHIWIEDMQIPTSQVSSVSAVLWLLLLLPGPLYNFLGNAIAPWKSLLIITVLLLAGHVGAAFSHEFWQLILSVSICVGISGGLVLTISTIVIERYFDVHKEKIFALIMAANSLGAVIGPILIEWLIRMLGVRNALLVEAGIFTLVSASTAAILYVGSKLRLQQDEITTTENDDKDSHQAEMKSLLEIDFVDSPQTKDDTTSIAENEASESLLNISVSVHQSFDKLDNRHTVLEENLDTKIASDKSHLHHSKSVEELASNNSLHSTARAEDRHHNVTKMPYKEIIQQHKYLIKDPVIWLMMTHYAFLGFAENSFLIFVVVMAVEKGFTLQEGAIGATLQGVTSTIVCLMCAALSRYLSQQSLSVHLSCLLIMTVSIVTVPFTNGVAAFYAVCLLFGIGESGYLSLIMSNVMYTFGSTSINERLSYIYSGLGIGLSVGPFIEGFVISGTGTTAAAFYMGGGAGLISLLLLLPLCIFRIHVSFRNQV